MVAAFAEYERNIIRERTMAELEAARKQGRVGGRLSGLTDEAEVKASAAANLYQKGRSIKEVREALCISNATVYKYLKHKNISLRGRE